MGKDIVKKFLCAIFLAAALATSSGINVARADISRLPPNVVAGIAALGPNLNPQVVEKTFAMTRPLAPATPPASVTVTKDIAYGEDPLQKLDIYMPAKAHDLPIAVYVHGGGLSAATRRTTTTFRPICRSTASSR